MAIYLGEM